MKKKIKLIFFVILIILLLSVLIIKLIHKKNDNNNSNENYLIEYPKGKTLNSLSVNDDIKIGTEKFKVFKTDIEKVYAMPYYNITLEATNPKQTELSLDNYIQFVDTGNNYWKEETDIIDMEDTKNNIEQYIIAYSNKLSALDSRITARVARYSEMKENQMTNDLRNPGKNGIFWIGSAKNETHVYYIEKDGKIDHDNYEGNIGVRPIIIIRK